MLWKTPVFFSIFDNIIFQTIFIIFKKINVQTKNWANLKINSILLIFTLRFWFLRKRENDRYTKSTDKFNVFFFKLTPNTFQSNAPYSLFFLKAGKNNNYNATCDTSISFIKSIHLKHKTRNFSQTAAAGAVSGWL